MRRPAGVHNVDAIRALAAQIEPLYKKIDNSKAIAVQVKFPPAISVEEAIQIMNVR